MVKHLVARLIICLLLACLSACDSDGLLPNGATEDITLLKNGYGNVRYSGEMFDVYESLTLLEKFLTSKNNAENEANIFASRSEYVLQNIQAIKNKLETEDVNFSLITSGNKHYFADYQASFKSNDTNLPLLIKDNDAQTDTFVSFVALNNDKDGFTLKARLSPDDTKTIMDDNDPTIKDKNDLMPFVKSLQNKIKTLNGQVNLVTDAIVIEHNADSVENLSNGSVKYHWDISYSNFYKIHLMAAYTKYGVALLKLKNAKAGTTCIDLIGEDCKCGPFNLVDNMGNASANMGYELYGPEGMTTGCTNFKGDIPKVMSPITGECTVKLTKKCNESL